MAYQQNFITGDPMLFEESETNSEHSSNLEPKSQKLETLSQELPTLPMEFPTLSQEFNLIDNLEQANRDSPVETNNSQLMPGEEIMGTSVVEIPPVKLVSPERKGNFTELKTAEYFNIDVVEVTVSSDVEDEKDIASSSKKITKVAKEERSASSLHKITKLPQARIKSIMKKDPEVSNPSTEAVFLVSKAAELFIKKISRDSYKATLESKKRSLRLQDVDTAIETNDCYAFLQDS